MNEIKDNYGNLYMWDEKLQQVNFLDQRFYKRGELYYPSITYILQSYPKDEYFLNWLKQHGQQSDWIVKQAAREGTIVHKLIEDYLNGYTIEWLNPHNGEAKYPLNVWQMFLRFVEFWTEFKPILIKTEILLFSDKHKIAGTCDLVVELFGKIWVIDLKTSNLLHKSHDLQVAAYVKCFEEMTNEKVDNAGILWLKSSKRKLNKEKLWGKGWELYQSPKTIDENWSYFQKVHELWELENPNPTPLFNQYPTILKKE